MLALIFCEMTHSSVFNYLSRLLGLSHLFHANVSWEWIGLNQTCIVLEVSVRSVVSKLLVSLRGAYLVDAIFDLVCILISQTDMAKPMHP